MKVILVNGSPNKNGCTYTALCEVEKELNANGVETEIFWIGNKPIGGCIGCGGCMRKGECVFNNDPVNEFAKKAAEADGFVFGTPVHYAGAGGAITAFMDRVFYSQGNSLLRGKAAAAISSCRRGGSTATFDQMNKYFTITSMPVVSSQYWNEVHGNTPDEVRQDIEGMQIMRTLGKNMAWLLKCIELGRQNGIEIPPQEAKTFTNFIR